MNFVDDRRKWTGRSLENELTERLRSLGDSQTFAKINDANDFSTDVDLRERLSSQICGRAGVPSPGQSLPDGRVLIRLLPEAAEFEHDGRRSRLTLSSRTGGQLDTVRDTARPPTPVIDNGPSRDH